MNRTTKLKILYLSLAVIVLLVFFGLKVFLEVGNNPLLFAILILLIPGRLTGFYWKEMLTGRRRMAAKQYSEAVLEFTTFIEKLKQKPWIAKLIWLSPSFYTVSAKAMALNNIGACNLEAGALDEARENLDLALSEDDLYPIPHYNLALVYSILEEPERVSHHLSTSRDLGFIDDAFDRSVDRIKLAYANYEPGARI
ncbi:hypothetical protein [Roseibacillus persicicus]|uniref:hypothetical protein n=1 Tax=Roseibacillus persicicus TaxID=454148 RepID=UPI00280EB64A|nr:hypothetical protein [Roseibacillus persicicus]MDQ8192666.1 hypothetical protein [Roseibacillus persicicus]